MTTQRRNSRRNQQAQAPDPAQEPEPNANAQEPAGDATEDANNAPTVEDIANPENLNPDDTNDDSNQTPDPVADVLGGEELSFDEQLAAYEQTLADTAEAVKAANEAKRKIAELQSLQQQRYWSAFLDSAPDDIANSTEMSSVRKFVESGFKLATATGSNRSSTGTTRGPNQPISDTDRIAYAGISIGLLREGKKQADVGKALATLFPDYHQEAARGAAVNHGSAVRSMVVTDANNRTWGFLGFVGKVDRLVDRTTDELSAAYERIIEMATEEEVTQINDAIAAHK